MTKKDKTYRLSGRSFSEQGLTEWCRHKVASTGTEDFEKEIYQFILDWFSANTFMTVKTSGSTGKPKEMLLHKKYMEASARATIAFFGLKPADTLLLCLPMRYIAGKMMVVRAMVGELDLYLTKPSSLPEIVPDRVTFSAMVPLQLSELMKTVAGQKSLAKISRLIVGGGFVHKNLEQNLQKHPTKIWQTYGMTETMTHIALRRLNGPDRSGWYKPLPGVSVHVNENKCLVINAPEIGVEEMVTNDIAVLGANNSFRITGRTDNVIISGGVKFQPEEIERKIPGLFFHAFFIGSRPDDVLGEKIVLFVESGEGIEQKIFEIWQILEQNLLPIEVPKEIVFLPSFPRTPTGKIDRKNIHGEI